MSKQSSVCYLYNLHDVNGKEILVFGLPDSFSLNSLITYQHPLTSSMNGFLCFATTFEKKTYCYGMSGPVQNNNLNVVTLDGKIFSCVSGEFLNLFSEVHQGLPVALGGYYFDKNGKATLQKCLLDIKKMCFVLPDQTVCEDLCEVRVPNTRISTSVPVLSCYYANQLKKIENFKYRIELINLSIFDSFKYSDKPENYYQIHKLITKTAFPFEEIKLSREYQINDSEYHHIEFRCDDDKIVKVPFYLKFLTGTHSLIFVSRSGFGSIGNSGINYNSFQLIIKWLKYMVAYGEYPPCDELFKHKMNVCDWRDVCDFCDIPSLLQLFQNIDMYLMN